MRKRRKTMPGATYHIQATANRNEPILKGKQNREKFLKIIKRANKKYDFILHSYCLLFTQAHLMITPGNTGNISYIMRWILSVYAKSYNISIKMCGHVWYDRFKSWIVNRIEDGIRYLFSISTTQNDENPIQLRYINPFSLHKSDTINFKAPP